MARFAEPHEGQTFFFVPYRGEAIEVTVTRVGGDWLYLEGQQYRIEKASLQTGHGRIVDRNFNSAGFLYATKGEYEDLVEKSARRGKLASLLSSLDDITTDKIDRLLEYARELKP